MKYIYTDTALCNLFRPSLCKSYPVFFKYHMDSANQIVINEGQWTAGVNMALDLICNERTESVNIKDIQCGIVRNDVLKYNIKKLSEFEFIGFTYDGRIASPIIDFDDGVINLNYISGRFVGIPTILYKLNNNAQFIYRKFVASRKVGVIGTYRFDVIADYLGLTGRSDRNLKIINDNLNQLKQYNLIKFTSECTLSSCKITRLF